MIIYWKNLYTIQQYFNMCSKYLCIWNWNANIKCQMNILALLICRMYEKSYALLFSCFDFSSFFFIYSFVKTFNVYGWIHFASRYEPIWNAQSRIKTGMWLIRRGFVLKRLKDLRLRTGFSLFDGFGTNFMPVKVIPRNNSKQCMQKHIQ